MNKKECYSCEKEFEYPDNDIYTSCETVEGQYIEFEAVLCPFCGCENNIWKV